MQYYFEKDYPLTFGHIDNRGIARPSALFDFMQDAATDHAEALQVSRDDLGAMWVLSRLKCTVTRPIYVHETVRVQTWCAGIRGATWMRAFSLSADGIQIGEAISAWAVLDRETHRILRPSQMPAVKAALGFVGNDCPPAPGKLVCAALSPHHVHTVRYSDLDINGHMNNVKAVDIICDGLELEKRHGQFVSHLQVNYTAECMTGEQITLSAGTAPDGTAYIFGTANGHTKFEAAAQLSPYDV